MKKISLYIIIVAILGLYSPCVFAETQAASLSKIENSIFGYDYANDSIAARIERIEHTVYGRSYTGDINKRLKKLSEDISSDVIGLEISPVEDTFMEEEEVADNSVSYPIVDEIEQKLFNETYKNRDFHTRIVTIEKKLFGKIYDVDDYSTRMDRIKSKVMPETVANAYTYDDNDGSYFTGEDINRMNLSSKEGRKFRMPFGQRNYTRPYTNYGEYNYNAVPNNMNLEDDLAQMEYDMFGTEFSNETMDKRIKRLNSAHKAKKSYSKYDSQKFSQHMSTAMEIGAMILMILAMVL